MQKNGDLSHAEALSLLDIIKEILWFDMEKGKWDPNKELDAEAIDYVASILAEAGLKPDSKVDTDCLFADMDAELDVRY